MNNYVLEASALPLSPWCNWRHDAKFPTMSPVALPDPHLTLSEMSHKAQRRHLTGSPQAGPDQCSQHLKHSGEAGRWGAVFSKLIASRAAWHPNTSQGTPAPLPAPTPLNLQRKPQPLQEKSGCFQYIKHTASKGNATACIKSANLGWFIFSNNLFFCITQRDQLSLTVKGVKKALTAAASLEQNDLPTQHSVTSSFTALSVSPSAGLETRPETSTHNRHCCPSLHNLIISRPEINTFSKWFEQKSFRLNMIFLHMFSLSS